MGADLRVGDDLVLGLGFGAGSDSVRPGGDAENTADGYSFMPSPAKVMTCSDPTTNLNSPVVPILGADFMFATRAVYPDRCRKSLPLVAIHFVTAIMSIVMVLPGAPTFVTLAFEAAGGRCGL